MKTRASANPRPLESPRLQKPAAWLLVCLLLLGGCAPREPILPPSFLPTQTGAPGTVPSYSELVERYNANVANLDRLWSSTDVELAWRDEKGKAHYERGDGNLLFVYPSEVALTVEKLGKTYLWAGSDAERFWLFDRQEDTAYLGHHRHVGRPCARPLPLPVHPSTVPYLLGLMPIERIPTPSEPPVEVVQGHYLIEPPGMKLRLLLDPQTALPVRVDLTDEAGFSVIIARLSGHGPMHVPQRANLFIVGEEARMTLELSRISRGEGRIQPRAFDFDALTRAMKPDQVVELDGACD